MNLGTEALGRLALGQERDALFTTTVLTAAFGSFSSGSQTVAFRVQEPLTFGPYTVNGQAVGLQLRAAEASGSFDWAGAPAILQTQFTDAPGGFSLTGRPAILAPTLIISSGAFTDSGVAVSFRVSLVETEPGVYALAGNATTDLESEVAEPAFYSLAGGAFLSHDFLGGGGSISGGTFSRARWRALQDEIAAEREREAHAQARDLARRRAAAKRAAAAAKAGRDAARAQEDAVHAELARQRAIAGAPEAVAGARSMSSVADGSARLIHAARAARSLAEARDEDEALALLLAA